MFFLLQPLQMYCWELFPTSRKIILLTEVLEDRLRDQLMSIKDDWVKRKFL